MPHLKKFNFVKHKKIQKNTKMAKTKKKALSKPGRGPGRPSKEETLRNGQKWKKPDMGKWKYFVIRVLKHVHPDIQITRKSMSIME